MNKKGEREGTIHIDRYGIEWIVIQELDGGTVLVTNKYKEDRIVQYGNLIRNNIRSAYAPIVNNIGYLGEGEYSRKDMAYRYWEGIIDRCYSPKDSETERLYGDCRVCDEWLNYQVFAKWFHEHYFEGASIDKDLLATGDKCYSPETCCMLPNHINSFLTNYQYNNTSGYPGVSILVNGKFIARYKYRGKRINLSMCDTIEEAFSEYCERRDAYARELAEEYKDVLEDRAYNKLMNYNENDRYIIMKERGY